MNIKAAELAFLIVGIAIGAGVVALVQKSSAKSASQPGAAAQRCFNILITAISSLDYDQFISVADDTFRQAITKARFDTISEGLAPRLKRGFTPTYLGHLTQNGGDVSLWRLTFQDGSEDRLARMSISQEKVNGMLITPAF